MDSWNLLLHDGAGRGIGPGGIRTTIPRSKVASSTRATGAQTSHNSRADASFMREIPAPPPLSAGGIPPLDWPISFGAWRQAARPTVSTSCGARATVSRPLWARVARPADCGVLLDGSAIDGALLRPQVKGQRRSV